MILGTSGKEKSHSHGLHGLILVNKPAGLTSHDVVARVRRCLRIREVGHAGTLDPIATGLLVLLVGEATKISQHILTADKCYEVKVRLGLITDTLDVSGNVLEERDVKVSQEEVRQAVLCAQGCLTLPVPAYSAVKVGGKKLYELARREEKKSPLISSDSAQAKPRPSEKGMELPLRPMSFFNVKLLAAWSSSFVAQVACHKGGYIRSWAESIGKTLGCGACVEELRRVSSGDFSVGQALSLEAIEEIASCDTPFDTESSWQLALGKAWVPLKSALPHWKALTVKGRDEYLMSNGLVSHDLGRRLIFERKLAYRQGQSIPVKILSSSTGQLLSLLEAMPKGGLKVRRIFQPLPNGDC